MLMSCDAVWKQLIGRAARVDFDAFMTFGINIGLTLPDLSCIQVSKT